MMAEEVRKLQNSMLTQKYEQLSYLYYLAQKN
jgi:hypothetical protein